MKSELDITIVTTPPPLWHEISKAFPAASLDQQIFAFADKIHWLHEHDGQALSPDLIAHETTHCRQQGFTKEGATAWWRRYAVDTEFRLSQELEAYRAQMAYARRMTKNRQALFDLARTMARNLSSAVYGNCISAQEAFQKITQ